MVALHEDVDAWMRHGPARLRDPFAPEAWAARARWLAPGMQRDPALLATFAAAHFEADPAGDQLVAWLAEGERPEARSQFERAVRHGLASVAAPAPAVTAFFQDAERVPAWLDRRKLLLASSLYHRTYSGARQVLFTLGLLSGYVSGAVAKVLASTGALEHMAVRRLAETNKFVTDVYGAGALSHGSAGFQSVVRVRVAHAMVRRQALKRGFDVAQWGVPINQADMALTALQFSITYVLGLRAIGFHVSRAEADAVLHLWRYVGGVLGVRGDLLPGSESEARQQLRLCIASQAGPTNDSRTLAGALLRVPEQLTTGALSVRAARAILRWNAGLARLVLGKIAADALGLPSGPTTLAPLVTYPAVFAAECVRRSVPFGTWLATVAGRRLAERSANVPIIDGPKRGTVARERHDAVQAHP